MKSWMLAMAVLLGIAWPIVSSAETASQEIGSEEITAIGPAPAADEVEGDVTEVAVEETEAALETAAVELDVESASAGTSPAPSAPVPVVPLDPARPLPRASEGSFVFGPLGVDSEGRTGRIHLVATGDTLWDISEAYLGTPWVWPSVWDENSDIENPHLIVPGDRIWISSTEMRRVSELEAEALMAAAQAGEPVELQEVLAEAPAAMDDAPVFDAIEIPDPTPEPAKETITIGWKESMGFVSQEALDAASSIVGSDSDRNWLAQGDHVNVGLGRGQVKPGDQFVIFSEVEAVRALDSQALLGYHIKNLGWLEIVSVSDDSSIATIKESWYEMERGARLIRRGAPTVTFEIVPAASSIQGQIVFLPSDRTVMGTIDHVYLDVGASDGLEAGSQLNIITPEHEAYDRVRDDDVAIPDHRFGKLVIISTHPRSSVALVQHTRNELEIGQPVRGSAGMPASN